MPEPLSLEQIKKAFVGDCDVRLLQSVDSTNEWCLQQARADTALPLACFAEEQTRGRGRRGRAWLAYPGSSISMSLAWRFDIAASEIAALSLAMGVAVVQTLEQAGLTQAKLKWPNDVLVEQKKIAGILIETANLSAGRVIAVIGVGMNYHLPDTAQELPDRPWTDVVSLSAAGADIDRSRLAGQLLSNCVRFCQHYPQNRDALIAAFNQKYDACRQQQVTVLPGNGESLHGMACGVTSEGAIRVLVDGEERVFTSAEISLRINAAEQAGLC